MVADILRLYVVVMEVIADKELFIVIWGQK
jgi:hypothetical protein